MPLLSKEAALSCPGVAIADDSEALYIRKGRSWVEPHNYFIIARRNIGDLFPSISSVVPMASVNQSQIPSKSVSMNLCDDDGVQRRKGDYHSNLWDDDFIQSLSTPYGAPCYRERAERLVGEVKEMFNSVTVTPLNDLIECLSMVDSVERLGIDRHFKNEIKSVLDHIYSYWGEKGIGCGRESDVIDLNSTALGFRTLRLHGYPVSSDVLKVFKNENGEFACSANIQTEGEIRGVLNLFRASLVAFPGENVMGEAEIFSTTYLKEALKTVPISSASLSREIEYVLEYRWLTNFPRLEAKNYIDLFGNDSNPSLEMTKKEKLLELAKLEFNIFHSLQQKELKHVSRWWKDSGFSELTFTRHRHVEFYTLASCIATEPRHSSFRLGFAKLCYLGIVLDDIYDTFGTMDELELFTAAIKRWDPSATECLPQYMKGVYMVFYDCVNGMAREAEKTQGRDTLSYARNTWEAVFDAFLEEAKWISSGYIPTFEEYLENGKVSFGYRAATLQPILTLDVPLPLHILQEIDFPSKFNDLASSILRLRGDVCGYKAERSRGEEASSVSCYMRDNLGATEEDTLNHIDSMIEEKIRELNWEFLKPESNVPISSKKHAFDILRAFYHLYKYRDGFSIANSETKNLVMRTVLEPVPF